VAEVTTINHLVENVFPAIIECMKEDNLNKLLEEGANYLKGLIDDRVHLLGLGSDEEPIASIVRAQTSYEDGDYSYGHGRKRDLIGLQTSYIDLIYTGELQASLTVSEFDNKIAIGFNSQRSGELANYHEIYRQKDIYAPSEAEIEQLIDFFNEKLPGYIEECLEAAN
jgi:hypothetical protein